jgi:predicted Zn-dependent protease
LIRVEAEIGGLGAGLAKAHSFAKDDSGNSLYGVVSVELHENAGRSREAMALTDKVAATHPSDDNLILALFRLCTRANDLAKAEGVLNARLKADPKNFAIRSDLAGFYLEQKNTARRLSNRTASSPTALPTRSR